MVTLRRLAAEREDPRERKKLRRENRRQARRPSCAREDHLGLQAHRPLQALPRKVTSADGKGRRGGYVFVTWKADHPPRHVHVYCEGKLVVKWDLDNRNP